MRTRMTLLAGLFLAEAVAAAAEPATYHGTKTLTPKPGGTLKVEGSFHDISVVLASGASVEVTVDMKLSSWPGDSKEALKAYEPTYSEEGNTILIRSRSKASFSMGTFNSSGTIAIRMPAGMNLDLHTGSGDVSFAGGASQMDAGTGSGSITAAGLTGPGTFEAGSGDIDARWVQLPQGASVKAESGSGKIHLGLPAQATLSGDLDTGSGDIRSDYPGTSSQKGRHWSFSGGAGACHLSVETGSGDILVVKGS